MLSNSFKWKHYEGEIILLNVRWYLKYPLSYRNLKGMMIERGIQVDHSTIIMRWVHQYSPEIEKKIRRHLRPTNDSWRVEAINCLSVSNVMSCRYIFVNVNIRFPRKKKESTLAS